MSTRPFLFEYFKRDLLVQIDGVKHSISVLENTIYDNPELLFNKLSLENKNTTKIVLKIKEYERCLVKLNEELEKINAHLARLADEETRGNVNQITRQMDDFKF